MSLIPEFIIQTTLVRGIRTLRADSSLLDALFKNSSQVHQAQIRDFINTQAIDLNINYPREALKVPAIVILLKNEQEGQAWLGDSMGVGFPEDLVYDGGIEGEVLGGAASVQAIDRRTVSVFGPQRVASATNNTLVIAGASFGNQQFISEDNNVHIIGGTGAGQIRAIVSQNSTTLMVTPNWTVNPDSTSTFEIREPGCEVVGEPASLYDQRNSKEFIERRGSYYQVNYQIQLIGQNPEATIYLFTIARAILTLGRQFLEGQGIINMQMSGTDFLPRTEYQPDFAYMRALNVSFMHPFDIFEALGPLATSFNLSLCDSDDVELSNTTSVTLGPPDPVISP